MTDRKNTLVAQLVLSHGGRLRRYLRSRVRQAADIPDIVQEVFLRLLRIPDPESIRAPEAYIFTVARHVAQQHSLHQDVRADSRELEQLLQDAPFVSQIDPAMEVSAQQCLEMLDHALLQLSPKVQATFLLHRRDGMSMDEVSAHLGISRPMAKKYLVKALVHLRKRLKNAE